MLNYTHRHIFQIRVLAILSLALVVMTGGVWGWRTLAARKAGSATKPGILAATVGNPAATTHAAGSHAVSVSPSAAAMFAPTFAESGATLTLTLSAVNETVAIVSNGTSYTFTSNNNWSGTNSANVTGNGTTTLTVTTAGLAAFSQISIADAAVAGTSVTFNNSGANVYTDNFDIVLDNPGAGTITFNGTTSFTGANTLSASTSRNIVVNTGASVTTANGDLTLSANQQATPTAANFTGVLVNGGLVGATGEGNVTVKGKGGSGTSTFNYGVWVNSLNAQITSSGGAVLVEGTGGGAGTSHFNYGVFVQNGGVITNAGTGAGATVTVKGFGGNLTGTGVSNVGVYVSDPNAQIKANGGAVLVEGTSGGAGTSNSNSGVIVQNGGVITNAGTGAGATVTVKGFGNLTVTGSFNYGVGVINPNSQITSSGGAVLVEGTGGGAGPSIGNYGVHVLLGGVITNAGTGTGATVTVRGFGGNLTGTGSSNFGVRVVDTNAQIASSGGALSVTGSSGSGASSSAIRLENTGQIVGTTGTPTVTLVGDSMDFQSTPSVNAGSIPVVLKPRTAGTLINLGGADVLTGSPLTLGLTDTELDQVTAGTLTIGDNASGTLTVSADQTRPASTNLSLVSGGDVTLSGGQVNTGGGTLLLDAGVAPFVVRPTKAATDVTASTLTLGGDLAIDISGLTLDTQYTQLNVAGAVNLTDVGLILSGAFVPAPGNVFTIVAASSVSNSFKDLANGSTFTFNGRTLQIAYTATTVTLTTINTAPTITAGAELMRQQGSAGTVSTIATVSDTETAVGSLLVTATTVPAGLTVTGITNTAGTITATVAADCMATIGANTVVLTVTDGNSGTATANLTVNVTATTVPTITAGGPTTFCAGGSVTLTSSSASGNQWYLDGGPISGATSQTYSANAAGNYTVTVTDNGCPSIASLPVSVSVTAAQVVTTNADSGAGSLRQAIADACPGSTITFAPGISLITLTSGELTINKNLTIQGPVATQLTISGNNTSRVFNISNGLSVAFNNLTIANGRATTSNPAGLGGGIFSFSPVTLTNCLVTGNSALTAGGGLAANASGGFKINNSTITGNSTTAVGSTGGGISNVGISILTNTTVTGNSSVTGGGIGVSGGTVRVRNTIVAGNTANSSPDASGGLFSLGNNLIGNNTGMSITPTTGDLIGTNAAPINPLLAPLGNYGGPTQTYALLPGSPAIDAGDNCVLTNSCASDNVGFNLMTDQRGTGFNRQVGSAVDIGAFESQGFTLNIAGGNNQTTATNMAFTNPLTVTITANDVLEPFDGGRVNFNPPGSGASCTVATSSATISGGSASSGTVTANGTAGAYSVSAFTNGAIPASFNLTNTAPLTVASINRTAGTSACVNTSVSWTVTFSAAVTGVTASNFLLAGGTGASITNVTGSGTMWTVTANVGTVAATLGLNMVNSTGVTPTVTGLTFTGQTYTINALPTITLGTSPTVALGLTTANLPFTATTGIPNQYSIDYNTTANNAGFVDVTNVSLPASPIVLTVPGAVPAATYNATLTVSNSTTGCVSSSVAFTISVITCPSLFTVDDLGDLPDANPGDGVCSDGSSDNVCTLRAALQEANALPACSPLTIDFSVTGTITLGTALPALAHPNLTITGPGANLLTVSGNNANRVFDIASGDVTLNSLTIANGRVTTGTTRGAGIRNGSSGTLTIRNCALTNNAVLASSSLGGGIYMSGGTLNIIGSIFSGNSVTASGGTSATGLGGGMYLSSGTVNVTNTTFANNTGAGSGATNSNWGLGGGIYSSVALTLTNCTFSGNAVTGSGGSNPRANGGGLYQNAGTMLLRNTLVAQNTASTGPDVWAFNSITSLGNNLIGDKGIATITNQMSSDLVGGGVNAVINPLLGSLGNYGGTTNTFPLLPGSPAINAGHNCVLTNACASDNLGFNLTTDQRGSGFNRQVGSAVDIGAFESRGFTLTISGGSPQSTIVSTNFGLPLQVSVAPVSAGEPVNGGRVTFTPPASGATATVSGNPATISGGVATTGTVTANGTVGGPYNVAAAAIGAAAVNFALTNTCPTITLNSPTVPTGTAGTAFGPVSFSQTGGNGSITWSVSSNNLPAGLILDSSTGVLNGTPTVATGVNVTIRATDAGGCFGERVVTIQINCPTITLTPFTGTTTTLTTGVVGQSYNQTFTAAPAGGVYTYSIPLAAIPPGLTFDTSTGVLSGMPTTVGTFGFTVTASAFGTCTGQQTYSLTINPTCPSSFTVNHLGDLPDANPGNRVCGDSFGNCTLRAAIEEANAITACSPLTINFSVTGTINLGSVLPDLNHPNLTINNGANPAQLTVRRNAAGNFRIFTIASGRTVTINGLTMRDGDMGASGFGGGLYNNNGTLTLNDCVVSNNIAGVSGAGIGIFSGTTTINRSTIADNTLVTGTSTLVSGAGMYINQGTVTLNATTFSGNRKNDAFPVSIQGAALVLNNATVTATNCTFSNNTGRQVIGNFATSQPNSLTLLNSTISNNTLNSSGVPFGAVETLGGSAGATATTIVKNTIVAGNPGNGTAFSTPATFSTLISQGNNLCGDATLTPTASGDLTNTNPLLGALGIYGGLTQTMALLPGSPAINAGIATGAPSNDQRGITRVGNTDIGAFESQGFTLAVNAGNNQTTPVTTPFANPLAATVTSSFSEPVNGGQVTFAPPGSGASATLAGNPATITGGVATSGTVTANSTAGGPYTVSATATGAPTAANFSLTNALVSATVNVPAGVSYTFNGQTVTGSQTFQVAPGTYTLSTTTPQSLGAGVRAAFSSWSDAGAISHSVTVGFTPFSITGNFTTQYQLTTAASPSNGGTVTPANGTFFDSGTVLNVSATPNSNFVFANWTGPVASASSAVTTVTMDAAKSITAIFMALSGVTINVPTGVSYTFNGQTVTGSQTFQVAPGTYPLSTTTPQSLGAGVRAVFASWSDAGAISHSVTVGSTALTITGNFTTQYQLTTASSPTIGGTVTPATGTYFNSGTVVNVSATPNAGNYFVNWTGPVVNANAAATTVTMDAAKSITANFALLPTVTSIVKASADPACVNSSVSWTVTFSASVSGVTAGNFALIGGTGANITGVSGSGVTWMVTANTGTAATLALGLNLVNSTGITPGLAGLPFTGQSYAVTGAPTAANAGLDQTVCGLTATLAGNVPTVGTGAWTLVTGPGTVNFSNASSATSSVTPSIAGAYTLRWTTSNAPCATSTDDVVITFTASPTTANAGTDQTVVGLVATLAGNAPSAGTGAWSQVSGPGTVNFGNASSPTASATASVAGAYTLRWTISNAPCTASTDDVIVTFSTNIATTTTLASSVNPSTNGQLVTFTATVSAGLGTPTGLVQFKDNGTPLGSPVTAARGSLRAANAVTTISTASISTSALTVGTHTITAEFSGDANFNASTGSLTQTVNPATGVVTGTLTDPLTCTSPGNVLNVSAQVSNPANVAQTVSFTATPNANLLALPNTCIASVGTCTVVNATTVTWNGSLPANSSVTLNYQVQVADAAVTGTQLCVTSNATFNGGAPISVTACGSVTCPQAGPGLLPNGQNAMSEQKPGSVLVYPIYSSSAANASTQNTRFAITNTNMTRNAYVHLFFVDGSSCSVADSYLCLTPNQTASILASDVDPGTTGYIIAVAVNAAGCPISFNHLIGDEFVKLTSGHASNLSAEAIAAVAGGLTACNGLADSNAVLAFNNVSYNALPRVLASSSIGSRGDANDTYVVIDRIGGNLSTAGATVGGLFGILYDDAEAAYSFSLPASACQSAGSITNDRPRTVPRFETVIPSGRTGWFKIWGATDAAILGSQINRNTNAATNAGAFNQGRNLHKLTFTTTATLTIPVFPPSC